MQIFNFGLGEILFIVILALIILGPKDLVNTSRKIGQWFRQVKQSPIFNAIMDTSREIRDLPNKIMDESGLEDSLKKIEQTTRRMTTEIGDTIEEIENTDLEAPPNPTTPSPQAPSSPPITPATESPAKDQEE